jgi:hypothetical protein
MEPIDFVFALWGVCGLGSLTYAFWKLRGRVVDDKNQAKFWQPEQQAAPPAAPVTGPAPAEKSLEELLGGDTGTGSAGSPMVPAETAGQVGGLPTETGLPWEIEAGPGTRAEPAKQSHHKKTPKKKGKK